MQRSCSTAASGQVFTKSSQISTSFDLRKAKVYAARISFKYTTVLERGGSKVPKMELICYGKLE